MTTDRGGDDGDRAGGAIPTRVQVARRSWLVPGLVVVLGLAVVILGVFGDKVIPRPPSPSTTPSTTNAPDSVSVEWEEITLDPATFDGAVVGLVVGGPGGVLALGQARTDRHPIAWTSEDGRAWVRTDLPPSSFGGGVPDKVVPVASGWVAVGYRATADGTTRDIWTSPDGIAWVRDPSVTGRGFDEVVALTGSGRSAVMVASVGNRQELLASTDGRVWAETPDLDATLGRSSSVRDVVGLATGFVAVGSIGSEAAIWRSADGHDWTRSGPLDPSMPRQASFVRVFRTAEGLLISGSRDFFRGPSSAWVSADGIAWVPSPTEGSASAVQAVFPLGGGNLGVTGDRSAESQGFPVAWAGAEPTVNVEAPTPQPFDWSRQAAVVDGRVLLVADKVRDGPIAAWLGTLTVLRPAAASPSPSGPGASASAQPSTSTLPPLGRPPAPGFDLAWSVLRSPAVFSGDGRDLTIAGIERVGSGLLAYGSNGYDARFWRSTDKSHWRLLAPSPTMRGAQVLGVATVGGRIVAVGQVLERDGTGTPAIWTSADGTSWKRAPNPGGAGPGQLNDVVAGPEGLVAVGSRGDSRGDGSLNRFVIWTSSDGSTWTSVTVDEDLSTTQLNAVARGAAGYVAVGMSEGVGGTQGVAFTSPDGRRWTKAQGGTAFAPVVDPAIGGFVNLTDVVAGDSVPGGPAFLAVGTSQSRFLPAGAVFSSPDGRTWSQSPADPALDGVELVSIVGWAGGLAAAGNVYSPAGYHPMIWISSDGAAWAPLSAADLDQSRSGDRGDAFMTDLVADGSGLVAVGGASPLSEPLGAIVWAGAGPGEIVADHACPAVIDSPARLGSMTPADRAACIGAVPVTVSGLVRSENNDCSSPEQPPALSGCGALLYVAPLEGGPDVAQIGIDPSLVERFGPTDSTGSTGSTPWKLNLRTDVIGPTCDPVPARNGVVYEPPEAVHLQCRALLRLVAQEPIKEP